MSELPCFQGECHLRRAGGLHPALRPGEYAACVRRGHWRGGRRRYHCQFGQFGPDLATGGGWAQRWGGPVEEIRPGDVVWFPPGEKHWHGATATTAMTHIAIQEKLDGKAVDWMEKVTDEQYRK